MRGVEVRTADPDPKDPFLDFLFNIRIQSGQPETKGRAVLQGISRYVFLEKWTQEVWIQVCFFLKGISDFFLWVGF